MNPHVFNATAMPTIATKNLSKFSNLCNNRLTLNNYGKIKFQNKQKKTKNYLAFFCLAFCKSQ